MQPFDIEAETAKVWETISKYGLAPSTLQSYRSAWLAFTRWCDEHDLQALPASPVTVVAHLVDISGASLSADGLLTITRSSASLGVVVAAVRWAHGEVDRYTPTSSPEVRAVVTLLRNAEGPAVCPATALTLEMVETVVADPPPGTASLAISLLAVGFFGAFRGGELVSIQRPHVTESDRGLVVFMPRSKGDAFGRGEYVAIARRPDQTLCPVERLNDWLRTAPDSLWLFPRPDKPTRHVTLAALDAVVKEVAAHSFAELSGFSSHSLRRGFATSAAEAGNSLLSIAVKLRHRSLEATLPYIAQARPGEAAEIVINALGDVR